MTNDPDLSIRMLRRPKEFARQKSTLIVPTHDPDVPQRLAQRSLFA